MKKLSMLVVCLSVIGVPMHAGTGSSKSTVPETDTLRKTEKVDVVSDKPSAPVKHVIPPASYVPGVLAQQPDAHTKKSRRKRPPEAVRQPDAHRESSAGKNHLIQAILQKAMSPERKKAFDSRINTPARAIRRQLRAMQQPPLAEDRSGRLRRDSEFDEWTRIFSESFINEMNLPSPSTPQPLLQPVVETKDVVIAKSEVLEPADSSGSESNDLGEEVVSDVRLASDSSESNDSASKQKCINAEETTEKVVSDANLASDSSAVLEGESIVAVAEEDLMAKTENTADTAASLQAVPVIVPPVAVTTSDSSAVLERESIVAVAEEDLSAKTENIADTAVPLQAVPVIVPPVAVATSSVPVAIPIAAGKLPVAPASTPVSTPQQITVLQQQEAPVVPLLVMSDEEKNSLNNVLLKALGIVLLTPGLGYFLYLLITKGCLRSYEDLAMILRSPAIYKSLTSRRKIEAIASAIAPLLVVTGTTMIYLGSRE